MVQPYGQKEKVAFLFFGNKYYELKLQHPFAPEIVQSQKRGKKDVVPYQAKHATNFQ